MCPYLVLLYLIQCPLVKILLRSFLNYFLNYKNTILGIFSNDFLGSQNSLCPIKILKSIVQSINFYNSLFVLSRFFRIRIIICSISLLIAFFFFVWICLVCCFNVFVNSRFQKSCFGSSWIWLFRCFVCGWCTYCFLLFNFSHFSIFIYFLWYWLVIQLEKFSKVRCCLISKTFFKKWRYNIKKIASLISIKSDDKLIT